MILPVDPIMSLVVTVAVFVYFALKGIGSQKKKEMSNEEFGSGKKRLNALLRMSGIRTGFTNIGRIICIFTIQ